MESQKQSTLELVATHRNQIDAVKAQSHNTATGGFRECCNNEASIYRRQ